VPAALHCARACIISTCSTSRTDCKRQLAASWRVEEPYKSTCARQGASSEYDAATAAVAEARQALDDAAEGERAVFVAAGADAKLAKRICVEDTEEGVVLRVRTPTVAVMALALVEPQASAHPSDDQ